MLRGSTDRSTRKTSFLLVRDGGAKENEDILKKMCERSGQMAALLNIFLQTQDRSCLMTITHHLVSFRVHTFYVNKYEEVMTEQSISETLASYYDIFVGWVIQVRARRGPAGQHKKEPYYRL